MNKALKIAIGIATIGIIGTAGYFIYQAIKTGRDGEGEGEGEGEQEPSLIDPPSVGQGGGGESLPKTPFTNKAQGDMFRLWVNEGRADYAKSIGLDLSGDFDNSYMRKAWMKYGETYKYEQRNYLKAKGNGIPAILLKAYNKRKLDTWLSIKDSGEIYLCTTPIKGIKIKNQELRACFYQSGKVVFSEAMSGNNITDGKWWDDGQQINVNNKNYKGSDLYNTAYKVVVDLKQSSSSFDGNLQGDLDVPSRRGLDLDMNIID